EASEERQLGPVACHLHGVHLRARRPVTQVLQETVEPRRLSGRHHFDAAVRQVAREAADPQTIGATPGEGSKPDTLYAPAHPGAEPVARHAITALRSIDAAARAVNKGPGRG